MINDYPSTELPEEFISAVKRERQTDLEDWNNLPRRFLKGRKVEKIPTSSADVEPEDKVGDVNYTIDYLYFLVYDTVNNVNVWRRTALSPF